MYLDVPWFTYIFTLPVERVILVWFNFDELTRSYTFSGAFSPHVSPHIMQNTRGRIVGCLSGSEQGTTLSFSSVPFLGLVVFMVWENIEIMKGKSTCAHLAMLRAAGSQLFPLSVCSHSPQYKLRVLMRHTWYSFSSTSSLVVFLVSL